MCPLPLASDILHGKCLETEEKGARSLFLIRQRSGASCSDSSHFKPKPTGSQQTKHACTSRVGCPVYRRLQAGRLQQWLPARCQATLQYQWQAVSRNNTLFFAAKRLAVSSNDEGHFRGPACSSGLPCSVVQTLLTSAYCGVSGLVHDMD